MQRTLSLFITFFCIVIFSGCSSVQEQNWTKLIPEESPFVIIPKQDVTISNISGTDYATVLDDLTPTALQHVMAIDSIATNQLELKALALYPSRSSESQFLWIAQTNQDLNTWAPRFYEPLTQNNYQFNGIIIHKLKLNQFTVFAFQTGNWLVLSQSSVAVENSLRAYIGTGKAIDIKEEPAPGQLLVNSEHLDNWVEQFVNVGYRPSVVNSFMGSSPITLQYQDTGSNGPSFGFNGTIQLSDSAHSVLIDALSFENGTIALDRFIASNAAAFAIFRKSPRLTTSTIEGRINRLDSLLISDPDAYRDMALTIDNEFAFVAYPESGLLSSGEFLYLRKLQSVNSLRNMMEEFADQGLVTRSGNSYYVQSSIIGNLIGSELNPFTDFYLTFSRDVAVIAKRRGLAESVEADRNRRRVIYYEETYANARDNTPDNISGLVWVRSGDFMKFISPFVMPKSNMGGLLGQYDIINIVFTKVPNSNSINLSINSVSEEGSTQPYNELWVLPLNSEELSGLPVTSDIIGSSTDEVIIATQSGRVLGLAFDGTIVMQASTDGEVPVGSPVIYDWYGNGQPVVMLAAGTKIFAWNQSGNLLPQFPIEIGERVSAPITVTDVLRNGIPEIIVATENRKIHIVDGRGQNVRGWPQYTNSVVTKTPVFSMVDNTWSVWAFSENILHSWLRNGNPRPGYPVFFNSAFTGSPFVYKDQILGAGADGQLYSIGTKPIFSDSLASVPQDDSVSVHSLNVTNSSVNNISSYTNVLLKDSTGFYRSDLLLAQSSNGSLFMYDPAGELKLTFSMGQPSSSNTNPMITDINADNNSDVIGLAEFGRLYAWEVLTGHRIFSIPTSGMRYAIVTDLNRDGRKEVIALTREGLRGWTINKEEK